MTSTPRTGSPGRCIAPDAAPDALAAEQQALRLGTPNALFYFHLGLIYDQLGDAAQARQNMRTALAINPYFSIKYAPQAAALAQR